MDEAQKQLVRQRIEQWRVAGEFMANERAERLRNMTDEQCFAAMEDVLAFTFPDLPERGSGLVEFQRILRSKR